MSEDQRRLRTLRRPPAMGNHEIQPLRASALRDRGAGVEHRVEDALVQPTGLRVVEPTELPVGVHFEEFEVAGVIDDEVESSVV